MPARRRPGPNEERQREMREQDMREETGDGNYEVPPEDLVWKAPRPGEWWALAPGSVIHMIARVNDKLRVTYVVPICGGKPSQARVEVPFGQLREPEYKRQVCENCWNDPRSQAMSLLRYSGTIEISTDEYQRAIELLEAI